MQCVISNKASVLKGKYDIGFLSSNRLVFCVYELRTMVCLVSLRAFRLCSVGLSCLSKALTQATMFLRVINV